MESCWLVANGYVYDATDFLTLHPAGAKVILRQSGGVKDCTEDYNFHRAMGKRFWNERKIGVAQ